MANKPADPLAELRTGCLLAAIQTIECSEEFRRLNFKPATYKLALEQIAAKAGELSMLLTMFGRGS